MNTSKLNGLIRTGIILLSLILVQPVFSQDYKPGNDSIQHKKNRKNTIKLNLTSPMIFGENNYVLGYERTIGKHQSFSIHLGTFSLGQLLNINTDSIKGLTNNIKSSGMSVSGDYRFYLAKENKYNSPHGIYIGPYFAYNRFARDFEFEANTASFSGKLNADFMFSVTTLGFQLGYQFVFHDRITLDMILFGPGISRYKYKAELSTNLDPDQESELFKKINEKLEEKIPGYSFVLEPATFEKTGSANTTSFGYRYIVMLGFRF